MNDIRHLITAAFDAPYTSNDYAQKLGDEALGALQYYLVRLGLAHPNLVPNCRAEVIAAIAKHLAPLLRPMPEDYMEDKVERVAGAYIDQFRKASTTAEYHTAYVDILNAVAKLAPSPSPVKEEAGPVYAALAYAAPEYATPGFRRGRISTATTARADMVKSALSSVVLSEALGQALPGSFLREFTNKLIVWAAAAVESSRLEQSSLRSLNVHVLQYLAAKRGYRSETLLAEIHEALKSGLQHLEKAKSIDAIQNAYVKIIQALVALVAEGVKGYRDEDQRLFDLAGKFGRHCTQPNSSERGNGPKFDQVLLRRGELVDFVDALGKQVGGVVTSLPDQETLFDIAARCGRMQQFIHRTPGSRRESKVDCVIMEPADVFRFAREMAKYQCAPAAGEKHSPEPVVSERELALMREVLELRRQIDSLNAARIAYANEFPLTGDGEPDIGNIHANIRRLKASASR